jgi:hypothetical protein
MIGMKYNIIRDVDKLNVFLNILPELQSGETYFMRLITRSKYVDSIKQDRDLKQCIIYNKKDVVQSIRQMETEIGTYDNLNNDEICVYLSPNPRSQEEVIRKTLIHFSKIVGNYNGEDPMKIIYQNYRRSNNRQIFYDMDFDKCDKKYIIDQVKKLINRDSVKVLYTKNGIHLLIKLSDIDIKMCPNWLNNISNLPNFDQNCMNDNNIPIPGCSQFGFVPYLVDL